jgi:hypothetical protein
MTSTTNTSTAREVAETIGCSIQTVMNKAKTMGLKFKGRSTDEHSALVDLLNNVRPRPRRVATKHSGVSLRDRITKHLEAGKRMIQHTAAEVAGIDEKIALLRQKREELVAAQRLLEAETQTLGQEE